MAQAGSPPVETPIGSSPSVTVIIPCFNAEKFLEPAIRSACQQADISVEVIAIDDGSGDGTRMLLEQLSEEFPQLRVVGYSANKGQAYAKNLGFELATGEYLAILDSDDYYASHTSLSQALAVATSHHVEVIVCGFARKRPYLRPVPISPISVEVEKLVNTMNWQLIMRADFLRGNKMRFSTNTPQREDFPFVLEVLFASKSRVLSPSPLLVHVLRPGSTMRSKIDDLQFQYYVRNMQNVAKSCNEHSGPEVDSLKTEVPAKYLHSTYKFWARPILERLRDVENQSGHRLVVDYLRSLELITESVPAFIEGTGNIVADMRQHSRFSGEFDVLRLVAEAEDLTALEILLSGRKLHHTRLLEIAKNSRYPWAQSAATTYVRHSQSATYLEEPRTDQPLSNYVRKVVLHIGFPKTGSSAIQQWMEEMRFDLLKLGVWYPIFGVKREKGLRANRTAGHSFLIRQIIQNKNPSWFIQSLASEIAALPNPIHTLFISSEMVLSHHFWGKPRFVTRDHVVEKLVDAFLGLEIEILIITREPSEWVEAYYKELMANPYNGRSESFKEFARLMAQRGLLHHEEIIDFLESRPGVGKVTVGPYSTIRQSGGSVQFVLRTLGLAQAFSNSKFDLRVNSSLSDSSVALIRQAKSRGDSRRDLDSVFTSVLEADSEPKVSEPLILREEREFAASLIDAQHQCSPRNQVATTSREWLLWSKAQSRLGKISKVPSFSFPSVVRRLIPRPIINFLRFGWAKRLFVRLARRSFETLARRGYRGGKIALYKIRRRHWNFVPTSPEFNKPLNPSM